MNFNFWKPPSHPLHFSSPTSDHSFPLCLLAGLKTSFNFLNAAKVVTTSESIGKFNTVRSGALFKTRRKGLHWSSSPKKVGTVGRPLALSVFAFSIYIFKFELVGSTDIANSLDASVYSWPQKTSVLWGKAANFVSELCICDAVPSNKRPQASVKRVSPQKSDFSVGK